MCKTNNAHKKFASLKTGKSSWAINKRKLLRPSIKVKSEFKNWKQILICFFSVSDVVPSCSAFFWTSVSWNFSKQILENMPWKSFALVWLANETMLNGLISMETQTVLFNVNFKKIIKRKHKKQGNEINFQIKKRKENTQKIGVRELSFNFC